MRIIFLTSNLASGGAQRTISWLSQYISSKGDDVSILSFSDDIFYKIKDPVKLISINVKSSNCFFKRVINVVTRYIRIKKYLSKLKPDCVFCMLPDDLRYLPASRKYKIFSSERNNPKQLSKNEFKKRVKLFNKCDGIVYQTKRAADVYSGLLNVCSTVIPNAVGNSDSLITRDNVIRKKEFSAIGRLVDQKDYITMIRGFKSFCDQKEGYKLRIYGIGPDEEKIKAYLKELKVENNVFLMGETNSVIKEIQDSSAYIMTSKHEGMPNSLMEALGAGLPCISTDCEFGPAELIEDYKNGILINVGDYKALTLAMLWIANNPDEAEKLGKNARNILNTNSIETIGNKYYTFVHKIAEK